MLSYTSRSITGDRAFQFHFGITKQSLNKKEKKALNIPLIPGMAIFGYTQIKMQKISKFADVSTKI